MVPEQAVGTILGIALMFLFITAGISVLSAVMAHILKDDDDEDET